jgi:hypothetical protein
LKTKGVAFRASMTCSKLVTKIKRLERIEQYLNPDGIEGPRTSMLDNLAYLSLFGFSPGELKEIYLIVVGHTPMARILAGKMNEKALKPLSDLVRSYEPEEALNLLRYCRLMSIAEAVASKRSGLKQEELTELFDLYESMVKVVTNRDMDWDRLIDEKISGMGGIHHMMVRKILKMMNQFQFLSSWEELKSKGRMEKEVLADYDPEKLKKVERVIDLVQVIDRHEEMFFHDDSLKASTFYRKLLNTEFHGTGRIFERLDSELVFVLLWITVHVLRGEVINFNPILSGVAREMIGAHLGALNEEVTAINPHYLSLAALSRFSKQLYEDETSFIVGTGFQLKVNQKPRPSILPTSIWIRISRRLRPCAGESPERSLPKPLLKSWISSIGSLGMWRAFIRVISNSWPMRIWTFDCRKEKEPGSGRRNA